MKKQLFVYMAVTLLGSFAHAEVKSPSSDDMSKEALVIELTGKDTKKITEEELYAEVVTSYRNNNEPSLRAHGKNFLKRFGRSHFADNVLFLQGQLALQNKNFPEALRYFQKISKAYPNSNKVVSASFSKALTYKRLNLPAEARRVFKEVMVKYPGSPESFRAEAELKLLN